MKKLIFIMAILVLSNFMILTTNAIVSSNTGEEYISKADVYDWYNKEQKELDGIKATILKKVTERMQIYKISPSEVSR